MVVGRGPDAQCDGRTDPRRVRFVCFCRAARAGEDGARVRKAARGGEGDQQVLACCAHEPRDDRRARATQRGPGGAELP